MVEGWYHMNEKFLELPEEKRLKIINAAMEVFGKNEYKRAVTDDIAAKAGISKGLLFYYFHNKRSLYLYLYQYCYDLTSDMVMDEAFSHIDDFFELIEYGANKKMALLSRYPHVAQFAMRAYYSQNEDISDETMRDTQEAINNSFMMFFTKINFSKFREGIDPQYIYRMLVWMSDGYLHEQQSQHKPIDLDEMMEEFHRWKIMFRSMVYKEEFL